MGKRIVIAGACRTAIGKMGGQFKDVPVVDLGTAVIKEALKRSGVPAEKVDMVYMGCVLQAGQGQNVARQSAVNAGIPVETPAMTLNILCGSGLEAVNLAATQILAGESEIAIAGGMESMDQAPYLIPKGRYGYRMGHAELQDSMIKDALTDAFHDYHMGITAENVAEKYGLTREELDAFAAESQQKASKAIENGVFKEEIVPFEVKGRKGAVTVVDTDEGPRPGTTVEGLSKLKACFKKDGVVTAGNASGINDGAAAVVVMSEEKAKELGVTPLAYWEAGALGGVDPAIMGVGPIAATRNLLKKTNLTIDDFDLYEANEAFATQSLAVAKELGLDKTKLNVNGGAIALGHPVGCSGCRILVTLIYEMRRRQAHRGLATLCIGGGMGAATSVTLD